MDNEEIQVFLGKLIRKYRHQQQKTIEELAEDAGIDTTYLGDVERGHYNVTVCYLLRLYDEFGRPRDFFNEVHNFLKDN